MTSPDVNVGHILLPVPSSSSTDEAKAILKRAEGLLTQMQSGTDFRQLAMANSADQTALQGGDLGWRKMAQLPGVFIEAVEKLDVDAVSEPIRSDAGYHLIKLYERRGGGEQLIEQHFARHILIKPNEIRDEETTISQLNELRDRVSPPMMISRCWPKSFLKIQARRLMAANWAGQHRECLSRNLNRP